MSYCKEVLAKVEYRNYEIYARELFMFDIGYLYF